MQSDFEMAGIHHQRNQQPQVEHQQQPHQQRFMVGNPSTSSPFYPNYQFPPHHQLQPLLHPIHHLPFTQQFFQYQQHPHHRSILEPSPQGDDEVGPFFPLSSKHRVSGYNGEDEEGEDALVRGSEGYCRQTSLAVSHCWQNQEDSPVKQPFWKSLCAEISNGNNNSSNGSENKQEEDQEVYPEEIHLHHQQIIKNIEENKCRLLFGELEAIYATKANANTTTTTAIHRIASESVLTADDEDSPMNNNVSFPVIFNDSNQASGATAMATTACGVDIGSESASVGGREVEVEAETTREVNNHKRKRRNKSNSMGRFFESLVKKLVNHQEDLQKRFMETIERLDEERKEREEAWREQELAKLQKEAAARANARNLASSREAALISYLEKLTGQSINFSFSAKLSNTNKRWPQAEVDALVQIRTCLESKFQEPGPKGVLWEEISNSMASTGFQRSARRCKEKWDNMHKCVKKTKDTTQGNNEKDKHESGENKNGSKKEDMEEVKEGNKNNKDDE